MRIERDFQTTILSGIVVGLGCLMISAVRELRYLPFVMSEHSLSPAISDLVTKAIILHMCQLLMGPGAVMFILPITLFLILKVLESTGKGSLIVRYSVLAAWSIIGAILIVGLVGSLGTIFFSSLPGRSEPWMIFVELYQRSLVVFLYTGFLSVPIVTVVLFRLLSRVERDQLT